MDVFLLSLRGFQLFQMVSVSRGDVNEFELRFSYPKKKKED
jgi:hypothetical protein